MERKQTTGLWGKIKIFFLIFIILILAIIVLQNWDEVNLDLLFWRIENLPLLVVLIFAFFAGALISSPIAFVTTRRYYLRMLNRKNTPDE